MDETAPLVPTQRSQQGEVVEIDRFDRVALIRLNRPDARNAINVELAQAFIDAVGVCQDAGAIVITGAGSAFCAGLDLRNLGMDRLEQLPKFLDAVKASEVPLVAAVNGPAVTGGFEIALCCDFIVASTNAAFADTHLRVGVYPGPVLVELPRRVGMAKAREMSLTGNFVDAATALRIGLANHVVDPQTLLRFTVDLAQAIAEQPAEMVSAMRRDWDETATMPIGDALRRHDEIARQTGLIGGDSSTLRDNMSAVISRSASQRHHP